MDKTIEEQMGEVDAELASVEQGYEQTELGNAKLFTDRFMNERLWVPENNQWFSWNDKTWQADDDGKALRDFEEVIKDWKTQYGVALGELKKITNQESSEYKAQLLKVSALSKWIKQSQRLQTMKNSLTLAAAQGGMTSSISDFDSKGHFFGVDNGIIDLRTMELITGDSSYKMTKRSQIAFNKDAKCPEWEKFISRIMEGNKNCVEFIQRVAGQAMFGNHGKDKLVVGWGNGANGKSTVVDSLKMIYGDYAASTDPSMLVDNGKGNKEYYMAPLKGVRLLVMSETEAGDKLAESLIKKVLDSGEVTARYPAGRVFEYQPVFTPFLCTNRRPKIGSDPAIWRRILLLPFTYTIPEAERNSRFRTEVLMPEAEGILNWCLKGAMEYQKIGLAPPAEVIDATVAYRDDQDKIGMFLREECEQESGGRITLKDFQNRYSEWCKDGGMFAPGVQNLKEELGSHSIEVRRSTGNINWVFGYKWATIKVMDEIKAKREQKQLYS